MNKIVPLPKKASAVGSAKALPVEPFHDDEEEEEEEEEIYVPLSPDCKELKSIYCGALPCVPKHEKDPDSPGVLARFCPDNYRYCVRLCRTKCCKVTCKCCCGMCSLVKFLLYFVNSIFLIAGFGLFGLGVYGIMKFDMGAGLLGAASLGIAGIGGKRKEGNTKR
jgi:hypothetical protein